MLYRAGPLFPVMYCTLVGESRMAEYWWSGPCGFKVCLVGCGREISHVRLALIPAAVLFIMY